MGLRLKGQLMALFLWLFALSLGGLIYFNLTLGLQDNQMRTEVSGRRLAESAESQINHFLVDKRGETTLDALVGAGRQLPLAELERIRELRQVEIFLPSSQRLFSLGTVNSPSLDRQRAINEVTNYQRDYSSTWVYLDEQGTRSYPIAQCGHWVSGWVGQEHFWPIKQLNGKVVGVGHVCVEVPRATLRLNLVLVGNLLLGAVFLVTSGMSMYLWGEFALIRPMQALMESEKRLTALEYDRVQSEDGLVSFNQLANLARSFDRLSMQLVKYQRELVEKTQRLEHTNEEYRKLNEQLEAKVEEKTREMKEFFSLVTHDLRIPLAAVAGYADLLSKNRQSELTEKQKKYVSQISSANRHAQEMVINLLEAMKYEFGNVGLTKEPIDLSQLAREIAQQLSVLEKSVRLQLPERAPSTGDPTKIARVLGNLVGNALRYASEVQLTIEQVSDFWRVVIEDNGPGIPVEQRVNLFERFKHIQAQEGSSGLGLGLYIVKRILDEHGSNIVVATQRAQESSDEPERSYTRFAFELPVSKEE